MVPPAKREVDVRSDRTSTIRRTVLNLKLRGDPLQSIGLAVDAGLALKFEGPSPSGSYHYWGLDHPARSVDRSAAPTVLAWVLGVFSVRFAVQPPKFVRDYLDYRGRGQYTLREYVPLKVARYLVSCETTGLAWVSSVWCCRFKRLAKSPTFEFANLVRRMERKQNDFVPTLPSSDYPRRGQPELSAPHIAFEAVIATPNVDEEEFFEEEYFSSTPSSSDEE